MLPFLNTVLLSVYAVPVYWLITTSLYGIYSIGVFVCCRKMAKMEQVIEAVNYFLDIGWKYRSWYVPFLYVALIFAWALGCVMFTGMLFFYAWGKFAALTFIIGLPPLLWELSLFTYRYSRKSRVKSI